MRHLSNLIQSAAALALLGCGSATSTTINPPEVTSDLARDTAPQVSPADQAALVTGNTDFAFGLYQRHISDSGNLFFSPYSISQAVAMVYAGARTQTEQQIAQAMDFTLPQAQLHPAMDNLDLILHSRGAGAQGADGKSFQLNLINALWGQTGYPFVPSFLDVLALDYGAGLRVLNFASDPNGSLKTINGWVSQQTDGLVPDLLQPGTITPDTRFVLTNAIYFNGAWGSPFDPAQTQSGAFHALAGDTTAKMMNQISDYGYFKGANYQAVELAYGDPKLAMTLIVPDAGSYAAVEATASAGLLAEVVAGEKQMMVALTLPQFKFGVPLSLKTTLEAMGMTLAFTPQADFSGISSQSLSLSDVVHQAFISIDESGTQAAAATAVIGVGNAAPVPQATLVVDRPFLFLIRDRPTGTVLFLGRVLTP